MGVASPVTLSDLGVLWAVYFFESLVDTGCLRLQTAHSSNNVREVRPAKQCSKMFKYNVTLHWRHRFSAFDSPNISSLWEFQSCTKQTCPEYWDDTRWNQCFEYLKSYIDLYTIYLCEILWNLSLPLFLPYYKLESFCFTCFAMIWDANKLCPSTTLGEDTLSCNRSCIPAAWHASWHTAWGKKRRTEKRKHIVDSLWLLF